MGTAGLILLLACANLANLLVVRGEERAREISIRLAIGAERSRLVRQLMTENLAVALLGGGLGVLIAKQGAYGLLLLASDGPEPLPLAVAVDARMMVFCLAMCVMSTLTFGLMPALRSVRGGRSACLNEHATTKPFVGARLSDCADRTLCVACEWRWPFCQDPGQPALAGPRLSASSLNTGHHKSARQFLQSGAVSRSVRP